MVMQNGRVKQGASHAKKIVFMAPNRAAVAAAPPAEREYVASEGQKKTPTPMLVRAELNPHRPLAISFASAPMHIPDMAPMADPMTRWAARPGE